MYYGNKNKICKIWDFFYSLSSFLIYLNIYRNKKTMIIIVFLLSFIGNSFFMFIY